jgi:hypothetical protein
MTTEDIISSMYFAVLALAVRSGIIYLLRKRTSPTLAKLGKPIGCVIITVLFLPCCAWPIGVVYREGIQIPAEQEQVRRDADRIIEAVVKFKADNGYYPSQLSDLVPKYFDALPRHPREWTFDYRMKGDEFSLRYNIPTHWPGWPGQWVCRSEGEQVPCYYLSD